MTKLVIITDAYFDGRRHLESGPFTIVVEDGLLRCIEAGDHATRLLNEAGSPEGACSIVRAAFVMPGLVESHCHLFLDGGELDVKVRQEYLKAPLSRMMEVGRKSVAENLAAGVTLVRDAGDLHGVNLRLKAQAAASDDLQPEVRAPGKAIRKTGRYGSFMAAEVSDDEGIVRTIHRLAPTADELKVILTGIIDFEKGEMKGGVQFTLDEAKLIAKTARSLGLRTFAHCSGVEGLRIAVGAGIDSIEHGFFMEPDIAREMADKGIAWVPTFSPVYFQYARPELAGWNAQTVAKLWTILRRHFEQVALAADAGVPIAAGSDAGSYGVPHGTGLIDELFFQRRAGMSVSQVLTSATGVPRRLCGRGGAPLTQGGAADLIVLEGSPFESMEHLRRVRGIVRGRKSRFRQAACGLAPAAGRA